MSFLDKFNEPISKDTEIQELYQAEYEKLEEQLEQSNRINENNINEINELKSLINMYINQLNSLKNTYNNQIEQLKAQINFEREINEKYLSKLVESNKNLNEDVKNLNIKSEKDNKEILSLFDNNKNDLSNSTSKIISEISNVNITPEDNHADEIQSLKEMINNNNKEVLDLISQSKEEQNNTINNVLERLNSQNDNISKLASSDEKIGNLKELINNNYQEVSSLISQNKENQNVTTSKIINEISNRNESPNNYSEEFNKVIELMNNNKQEIFDLSVQTQKAYDDSTNKIIKEISNSNNEDLTKNIIDKVEKTIQTNNQALLDAVADDKDNEKVEILNMISADLQNENYVNLEAYKKIKKMGLFDETFYVDTYNYSLDIDPLLHYIYKGFEENKQPNKDFDNTAYINSDSKIEESSLNPLVYFVTTGMYEGNIKINDSLDELNTINKYDIDYEIANFEIRGVKKSKRKPRIIVSLTTVPEHMYDIHYTIYSLLNQQLKADKVILWLNHDDFPNGELELPKNILTLKKNGLSIRFCDNLKSYNNIIPTIKTYPNDIVVTAKENIYYPRNWLKILYEEYKRNDNDIIAQSLHTIALDDDGNIAKYETWTENEDDTASVLNYMVDDAGVLYPPHCFNDDVTNDEIFMDLCEDNSTLWLWAMTILNNRKIKLAENSLNSSLTYVNPARELNLINESSASSNANIDVEIEKLLNKYPDILNIIKNE